MSCRVLVLGVVFGASVGCKPPPAKLVNPVEVQAPAPDQDRLAQTEAAKGGRSGPVRVEYCIGEDGTTSQVTVVESLDPEVDAIVVETVEGWTYEPATRNGQPYETCTDYTFRFRFAGAGETSTSTEDEAQAEAQDESAASG